MILLGNPLHFLFTFKSRRLLQNSIFHTSFQNIKQNGSQLSVFNNYFMS